MIFLRSPLDSSVAVISSKNVSAIGKTIDARKAYFHSTSRRYLALFKLTDLKLERGGKAQRRRQRVEQHPTDKRVRKREKEREYFYRVVFDISISDIKYFRCQREKSNNGKRGQGEGGDEGGNHSSDVCTREG